MTGDFYPRPPRGGRPCCRQASRSRSDFYPRPPRGGRRSVNKMKKISEIFLSTPSARRATFFSFSYLGFILFLSTPSARRATPSAGCQTHAHDQFLSTPSARRATTGSPFVQILALYFYPRPPRGGRPSLTSFTLISAIISIHALREEGDPSINGASKFSSHFYPRPPRGGRPKTRKAILEHILTFLSTPSARRATLCVFFCVVS